MNFRTVRMIRDATAVGTEGRVTETRPNRRNTARIQITRSGSALFAIDFQVRTDPDSTWVLVRRYTHTDMGGSSGAGTIFDDTQPTWPQMRLRIAFYSGLVSTDLNAWIAY